MSIATFLFRITAKRPMRLIEVNGEPYLERYYIGALFGRQVWLHHFVRNDAERHVHDHPWSALSVVLAGGYDEETPGKDWRSYPVTYRHRAPALNWISASKRHRIVAVLPGTWSLMIVGPRTGRGWFFYGADGSTTRGPSGGDDWHKTAKTRGHVYAARKLGAAMAAAFDREADACAYKPLDEHWQGCAAYMGGACTCELEKGK